MSTPSATSRSISDGTGSFGNVTLGQFYSTLTSPSSYSYTLAREAAPYHPFKSIRGGETETMSNICAMDQYAKTSPEELRLSWCIEHPRPPRDTSETTAIGDVSAVREWEREGTVVQGYILDSSPAMSTSSLSSITRSGSPALSTSSGSTIKASSFARNNRAASEIGTPVLTTRGLPAESASSQTPPPKGKEKKEETPLKRFSSMPLGSGVPSTPANSITGGLWGRSSSSSSGSPSSGIPPSPAAERYPSINTAEREWEAALRDARHKKALFEEAQAAYHAAIALERVKFKAYSEVRMKFDP